MQTSSFGRGEIARREGTVLTAYKDSAGVLTIGVGHTSAAGQPKVTAGMKISAWEADQILTRDLRDVEATVAKAVKVPLNQNEFDALVSFVFNVGGTAFKGSTLLRKLNAGDRAGAADQFLVWNKITKGGKKVALAGLTTRRQDERRQFLNKQMPEGAYPATQPAQEAPKPVPVPQSPPPEPAPQASPAPAPEPSKSKPAAAAGGLILAIAAAAAWWHDITSWIGSFFQ